MERKVNVQKSHIIVPTIPLVSCRNTLPKLEVWICGNIQKSLKNRHICQKLKHLVRWRNTVTTVVRSICLLQAHMRKDIHATLQLHCRWWSGQCHAKHAANTASGHNTCIHKIVCYLQRLFNRNLKLKQVNKLNALKLGVCSKINACYIFVCIFFQICQHSNF